MTEWSGVQFQQTSVIKKLVLANTWVERWRKTNPSSRMAWDKIIFRLNISKKQIAQQPKDATLIQHDSSMV